ncbi:hypothetical protein PMAYCL1PPCAC_02309, partial [Pristionchus mayeri]
TGRKRVRGPRKTIPKPDSLKASARTEEDWEIALAVCQVVKDLVCQVADLPYGDLKRKRPPFFNVMRKFVRDSVQTFQDAEANELPFGVHKKAKYQDEHESPYGIELVWGVVLAEMEKIEKRERARIYSSQKAARQREKKRQEAIEAARAHLQEWDTRKCESGSSEEEIRRQIPTCKLMTPLRKEADPLFDPVMESPPSSRFSDESDWAVRPHSSRKTRSQKLTSPRSLNFSVDSHAESNYPIFNQMGRGRGRGRGRGARSLTVRSILDATMGTELVDRSSPLHRCVTLTPSGHSRKAEPDFDFYASKEVNAKKEFMREPSSARGKIGRGKRGRGGGGVKNLSVRCQLDEWDSDGEKEEQRRLMESIETSGESSSQESHGEITNTIDEVVKRVNGMSELNGRGRKKEIEQKEAKEPLSIRATTIKKSTKANCLKRPSATSSLEEASTSVVKRRKGEGECEVITIGSDRMGSDDDSLFGTSASLTSPPHLDPQSSIEEDDASDSDILILDE